MSTPSPAPSRVEELAARVLACWDNGYAIEHCGSPSEVRMLFAAALALGPCVRALEQARPYVAERTGKMPWGTVTDEIVGQIDAALSAARAACAAERGMRVIDWEVIARGRSAVIREERGRAAKVEAELERLDRVANRDEVEYRLRRVHAYLTHRSGQWHRLIGHDGWWTMCAESPCSDDREELDATSPEMERDDAGEG